jgi:L-lactate dehydrogenase complex protein LldG
VATREALPRLVAELRPGARAVLSRVPEVPSTAAVPLRPHDLATLDLLVCEATLGVAENGAVWLPASRLGDRAALFLASHVLVVLDARRIVAELHEAYAVLDVAAETFGAFVAGPSKTADIEQSLVVGAQGAMGMTLLLVRS